MKPNPKDTLDDLNNLMGLGWTREDYINLLAKFIHENYETFTFLYFLVKEIEQCQKKTQ
jgi:hypothetical protein